MSEWVSEQSIMWVCACRVVELKVKMSIAYFALTLTIKNKKTKVIEDFGGDDDHDDDDKCIYFMYSFNLKYKWNKCIKI